MSRTRLGFSLLAAGAGINAAITGQWPPLLVACLLLSLHLKFGA